MKLENGEFRNLFKAPAVEWCAAVSNTKAKSNLILKFMLMTLKKYTKAFTTPCPYFGEHILHNVTMDRSVALFYPAGTYRFILRASDDVDKNILSLKFIVKSLA